MSQNYNKKKTVIVYLAMNTKKDESYGRDSRSMLEKSLDSLYQYYNAEFKHDIIIFYDNKSPFLETDQIEISKGRNEIKFQLLDGELWKPPDCDEIRNNPDPSNWVDPKFPVGYRNMMRWYGILIYKFLTNLGYEWYMRMDDDSLLHSKIEYDLFKYLYDNNYEYGFRTYVNDYIGVSNGLIEFCKNYIDKNNIQPTFIDRFIKHKNMWNTSNYNVVGYYNNFLISKLNFWMRDDVQHFLNEFDNSGYQYTRRWNDLISQAVTIQIFMDRNKIYQFNDFTYEHTTFGGDYDSQSNIAWGGIFPKVLNLSLDKSSYVDSWYKKYNVMSRFCLQTFNIKDIIKTENINFLMSTIANNEKFRPNNSDDIFYLGKYNDIEDVYLAIHDHYLLCVPFEYCTQFTYPQPIVFVWNNNKLYVINNKNIFSFDLRSRRQNNIIRMQEKLGISKNIDDTISFIPSQSVLINPQMYY